MRIRAALTELRKRVFCGNSEKCMADMTYGFCKDNAIAGEELAKLIANINC